MVTENFIEAMIFQNANLAEVPQYFIRTIKNVILNGLATTKDEEKKEGQASTGFYVSQNSYFSALAAHRVFIGPLSGTQQQRLLAYTLSPAFSVKRLQRELGASSERSQRDHSDFDTMMVRGARIVHKIQERHEEKFT